MVHGSELSGYMIGCRGDFAPFTVPDWVSCCSNPMPSVATTSQSNGTGRRTRLPTMQPFDNAAVRFTDAAIAAWKANPRTTRGGRRHYSGLAIATALTLRPVFRLALRRTEGLIGSIIALRLWCKWPA